MEDRRWRSMKKAARQNRKTDESAETQTSGEEEPMIEQQKKQALAAKIAEAMRQVQQELSLIHISQPTRPIRIS